MCSRGDNVFQLYNILFSMSKNPFQEGQGIPNPTTDLATFLIAYAKGKKVPIYEASRLHRTNEGHNGIRWTSGELQSGTPTTGREITVQEFLAKCDGYVAGAGGDTTYRRQVGSYQADFDGQTQIMLLNRQNITFADLRKVHAYSLEKPATVTFSGTEGLSGPVELIKFLVEYAYSKGVPLGSHGDLAAASDGEYNGRSTRLRWNESLNDLPYHGLIDYNTSSVITVQDFINRCDAYAENSKYSWQLTGDYGVRVNHTDEVVQVGCQNIAFTVVAELIEIVDRLEEAAGTSSK